ncbi:MAG: threonine-phosphate decarboxylase CobD [Marinobacterium sp.]|nr:threonine-phosphate decarboxylase CobD [Marinobacterium sp.]
MADTLAATAVLSAPSRSSPVHGGALRQAVAETGIAQEHWLDLSTGISPFSWQPVTPPPLCCWQRLPEDNDGLEQAAGDYYTVSATGDCSVLLPVAGSQAAIQLLPLLRPAGIVALAGIAYAEHAHHWQRAGHSLLRLDEIGLDKLQAGEALPDALDVLLLINPTNPTGRTYRPEQLLDWHRQLAARGGWLIVDEAFMDMTPQYSLSSFCGQPGLIVLRSVGKFFGLAGARVGFVLAWPQLLQQLALQLGPWTLAGPSRWWVTQALQDNHWQQQQRHQLSRAAKRLQQLLFEHDLVVHGSTALFQYCCQPDAEVIYQRLRQNGVLVRLFEADQYQPAALRFGLPGEEKQWLKLQRVLQQIRDLPCE